MTLGLLSCLLLLLMPATSHAQINVDSLEAFLDNDKNCGDFAGVIEATRHHRALQIIVNDDDADPHGLDADGNGIACEGKTVLRRKIVGDTTGYWIETREVPYRVKCPTVPSSFRLSDYKQMAEDALTEQVEYLAGTEVGIWSGMDCLHSLGVINEAQ